MPIGTVISLACEAMTICLWSFSNSLILFGRQWQRIFNHPQRFFRCTYGRFLHIVPTLNDGENDITVTVSIHDGCWIPGYQRICPRSPCSKWHTSYLMHSPSESLYPHKAHDYSTATNFQTCFHTIHGWLVTEISFSEILFWRPIFCLPFLNGVLFTEHVRSTVT